MKVQDKPRPLRADATRNRDAILAAAREVFAEHGLEASLEEIAARARVGIATLYRRFPSRQHLVGAALVEKVAKYADAAEAALAIGDPWEAFANFVRTMCELQAGDRGLADLLSMTLPADEHVERLRKLANAHVAKLIDRAKTAGVLRSDFVSEDLLILLIANATIVHVTRSAAPAASRRLVALALDAFGRTDSPALPAPPTTAEMANAMCRLAADRGCSIDRAIDR
ncbi:MAG TPA: helix-turn-helix domain-containing protein [Streptosporangiaceae bacterium]|nr:helix-turn-helix domain-containing protein [Streptosporangiaceae bacterium]